MEQQQAVAAAAAENTQLTYQQRLQQSSSEKDSEEILFKVQEAKLQLKSDRLETQRRIANKVRELNKAKTTFPFSSSDIVMLQNDLNSLRKGLEALDELEAELFPA